MNGLDINLSVYTNRLMNCQWKSYLEKMSASEALYQSSHAWCPSYLQLPLLNSAVGAVYPDMIFSVESAEECNIVAKSICKAFTFRHCMNALTNIFLNPKKHRNNCKCCPVSSVTLNCNNDCNEVRIIIYISKVTWIVPISCSQTLSVCFLLLYIFHRAHHVIHKK